MSKLFHQIDDAAVILSSRGVFRQAKVFYRGEKVFASWGTGFIRLMQKGATSIPNVSYSDLSGDGIGYKPQSTDPIYQGETE